jgi:8-amino-7-oxononanoate synthase
MGAFVMSKAPVREFLVNTCRSLIFSTSMPAVISEATRAAVRLVKSDLGSSLRNRLFQNIRVFYLALGETEPSDVSPIVPIMVGEAEEAVALSKRLLSKGFLVPAIRPPTVAEGRSRLRISICASHTESQLVGLAKLLISEGFSNSPVAGVCR